MSGAKYHYRARKLGPDDARPLSMEDRVICVMQDGQERTAWEIAMVLGESRRPVAMAASHLGLLGELAVRREQRTDGYRVNHYRLG